jgi:hypothetical protein
MDWIQWAHNRTHWLVLAKMAMKLWIPSNVGDFLTDWATVSFLRTAVLHWVVCMLFRDRIKNG